MILGCGDQVFSSLYVMTSLLNESNSPFMKACSHLLGWVNIYPEPVPRPSHPAFACGPGPGRFPDISSCVDQVPANVQILVVDLYLSATVCQL